MKIGYARKITKETGVLIYKDNGLYYFYIYGLGILIYGKTLDDLTSNTKKILDDLIKGIKSGEIKIESLIKDEPLKNRVLFKISLFLSSLLPDSSKKNQINKMKPYIDKLTPHYA
ncbi:hypothetical protein [Kosmotoga sp. DU53]|uniref:hypothetical protein n=1 Tax=Kosmotoga sp. DU53 TaxID=1310160 RepID=UPI0007C4AFA6|nr:hypothetical protein [Kosmotoga sp. DU53]OAA19220.1 hypothetical protein DU53_11435 [Kosmotoga sp. DU53]